MLFAHSNTSKYIVYFKDKPTNTKIEQLFSAKAIEKRNKMHISFDERDFPINANYVQLLKDKSIEILNQSNWLNAVLISMDGSRMEDLKKMDFIVSIIKVEKLSKGGIASTQETNECQEINNTTEFEDNYVNSFPQFNLLNGEYMHEQGFNGENMTIAICDNGFYNANNNEAFLNVFNEKRVLGTYDYVHGDSLVFDESAGSHGAYCFSFIAAKKDNEYIGTASKANFYLFHTEDNGRERLQEEFNLASALERCDQLGVDVVSISLGYFTFDVASENHDTTDMMENITPAAKAVNMASSRGILVCVAAGNEGNSSWKYTTTPSDADSAFCIAAVDINGNPASFSSYGLSTDTRVKPNVAAVGQGTTFVNTSGNLSTGSGTSYATPSLAGMATCLWQAFPNKTNWEIKTAIEQSASQYYTPDKKIGYGIPDFKKAYQILSIEPTLVDNNYKIYPNPFQDVIHIGNNNFSDVQRIKLTDVFGKSIVEIKSPNNTTINLGDLPKGVYILQVFTNNGQITKKLLKE